MIKYTEITPIQAQDLIVDGDTIILDARDSHSYRGEHIEGALLAHDQLLEKLIRDRSFSRPVIVYCYHGNSSKELAQLLASVGFYYVHNLTGGFTAWKKTVAAIH